MEAMEEYYHKHPDKGVIKLMSGVVELLNKLRKINIPMGLLTGNVGSIGWDKVRRAGIKDYFLFGAFGDLAFKRVDLIVIAKQRAEKVLKKKLSFDDLFIVGDSPLDIVCAKAGGKFTIKELELSKPDLILSSLKESEKFIDFLIN